MDTAYHYPEHLELVTYPHPVLRKPAAAVTTFDQNLASFCDRMLAAMRAYKGVGLAAPQVAVSQQIFVSDHGGLLGDGEGATPQPRVWINPHMESVSGHTVYEEGCLSFPGIYAKVERADRFIAVWQDIHGEEHRQELHATDDVLGIVFQHELDHLHGKLFVDLLNPAQITMIRRRLREMEQTYKKETGKVGSVLRR